MSKKIKGIQNLLDEVIKQRNVYEWLALPTIAKKIQDLIGSSTHNPIPSILFAESLIEQGKYEDAHKLITATVNEFSSDPVVLYTLGRVEYLRKNYAPSLKHLQAVLDILQKPPTDLTELNVHYSHAAYKGTFYQSVAIIAHTYEALGEDEKAMIVYQRLYHDLLGTQQNPQQHLFVLVDGFSLFMIQYSMLELPALLAKQGKVLESLQFLRKILESRVFLHKDIIPQVLRKISMLLVRNATTNAVAPLYATTQTAPAPTAGSSSREPVTPRGNASTTLKSLAEEALFVLLLVEQLTSTHPSLKQDPSILSLYNDACMLLSTHRQYSALAKFIERGLIRSYESYHFWYQFALALMAEKKYAKALKILSECEAQNPRYAPLYLLQAKICLNHMGDSAVPDALKYAEKAVHLGGLTKNQALHCLGLTYGNMIHLSSTLTERQAYQAKAIETLMKAYEVDRDDPLLCYHIALQYAENREIRKAYHFVKKSIAIDPSFADPWILLTLLFSAEKKYKDALQLARNARIEHPTNIPLMMLNAKLDEMAEGEKRVAKSYKDIIDIIRKKYNSGARIIQSSTPLKSGSTNTAEAAASSNTNEQAGSVSIAVNSINVQAPTAPQAAVQQDSADISPENVNITLSESLDEFGKERITKKIEKAYLFVADYLQRVSKFKEAAILIKAVEDVQLQAGKQASADVHFFKGLLTELSSFEDNKRVTEATLEYENALIQNSNHKGSLLHLGALQCKHYKKQLLARTYLQSAVRVDPNFHEAWYYLGVVMREIGEVEEASDHFITALKLEQTAPVIPFESVLKRKMHITHH